MSELQRYHVLISGRVQGVGYRFFVIEEADRLGLHGWVRNLPDGQVETEVDGTDDVLQEFVKRLKIGPRTAHVTNVVVETVFADVPHSDFRIR